MHFCSVGLNLGFVCVLFLIHVFPSQKNLMWLMLLFGFFSLSSFFSTDVISEYCLYCVCYSPVPFCGSSSFCRTMNSALMGSVVTISNLREVLKAKTETKRT